MDNRLKVDIVELTRISGNVKLNTGYIFNTFKNIKDRLWQLEDAIEGSKTCALLQNASDKAEGVCKKTEIVMEQLNAFVDSQIENYKGTYEGIVARLNSLQNSIDSLTRTSYGKILDRGETDGN